MLFVERRRVRVILTAPLSDSQIEELGPAITDAILEVEIGRLDERARAGFQVWFQPIPRRRIFWNGEDAAKASPFDVDIRVIDGDWPPQVRAATIEAVTEACASYVDLASLNAELWVTLSVIEDGVWGSRGGVTQIVDLLATGVFAREKVERIEEKVRHRQGLLPPQRLQILADALVGARSSSEQIAFPEPSERPTTPDGAYQVDALVADTLGWKPLGWKIACTSKRAQDVIGMNQPIYGRSYRRFAANSPARLAFTSLCDPMIECEFFVTLAKDLIFDGKELSVEEVASAVGSIHAGIELAEIRFPLKNRPTPMALLADGSANGRYIFGPKIELDVADLPDIRVELYVNGQLKETRHGRDVLGHPFAPIAWLAKERARWGEILRAGEVISTGTCTGIVNASSGDRIRASFQGIGNVEVEIT